MISTCIGMGVPHRKFAQTVKELLSEKRQLPHLRGNLSERTRVQERIKKIPGSNVLDRDSRRRFKRLLRLSHVPDRGRHPAQRFLDGAKELQAAGDRFAARAATSMTVGAQLANIEMAVLGV